MSHTAPDIQRDRRESDSRSPLPVADTQRDRALTGDVRDVLAHHRILLHHDLVASVRGGVAHVAGTVASDDIRALARRVIGRVRGIHAVWDVLRMDGDHRPRVIDLGCGRTKQHPWAIGVDAYPYPGVDLVADIERGLPFGAGTVDQVFAVHFLEHLHDLLGVMNEIHRVLAPGGVLHVIVPNGGYVNAFADPTHVRYFHVQTFKYFCVPHPGLAAFRPLSACATVDNIYADLQPVQRGEPLASDEELARFFD